MKDPDMITAGYQLLSYAGLQKITRSKNGGFVGVKGCKATFSREFLHK
jgi:hypothetical protein